MKYLHKITIGVSSKRPSRYCYNYGNTKNIRLAISKKGASIEVMLSRKLSVQEILKGNCLFADAIKKVLLVYLIKYSESLTLKVMTIQIESNVYNLDEFPQVYSMVKGALHSKMSIGWNNKDVIQDILWFTKSTSKQRMASLYALLIAKSKQFESEKFMYLWMAFNGMYGYLAQLKERGKWCEWQEIVVFQEFNGWGRKSFSDKVKVKLHQVTKAILNDYGSHITKTFLKTEKGIELDCKMRQMFLDVANETIELSVYGFLMTQFAYWLRCELFHANKPTMFFALETDKDLKYLRQINSLLEEYLDENLYKWFDKNYRDSYLKIKIQQIEKTKKQTKGDK